MSKFVIRKKVDLSEIDKNSDTNDWSGAYVVLTSLAVKELKGIQKMSPGENATDEQNAAAFDEMVKLIQDHFISGSGFDGTNLVAIEKEDVPELPYDVLMLCVKSLAGTADPKY